MLVDVKLADKLQEHIVMFNQHVPERGCRFLEITLMRLRAAEIRDEFWSALIPADQLRNINLPLIDAEWNNPSRLTREALSIFRKERRRRRDIIRQSHRPLHACHATDIVALAELTHLSISVNLF